MAQAAAVGVAGAEVGCPEMDDGRALTGGTRDGGGTERTQGKQRETDTQTVSRRTRQRSATLIITITPAWRHKTLTKTIRTHNKMVPGRVPSAQVEDSTEIWPSRNQILPARGV